MAENVIDLPRSARATRGKRMSKLLDEEAEADQQFWSQEAFQEDIGDMEYEVEEEIVDEFDSDFDEDEPGSEDEAMEEEEERRSIKKKQLFPPGRKLATKKDLTFNEAVAAVASIDSADSKPKSPLSTKQSELNGDTLENSMDLEGERTVRKSTRTAVIVRQAERDALRAALQATIKPVKKKKEGEERRMSQEEMLLEAAQTEIINRQNLEKMLAREEEVKQKAIVHKTLYGGPQIRFHSKNGKNVLEFIKGAAFPQEFLRQAMPYPNQAICVVTGLPAKYVDPLTGLPFAKKEAFKIIRERLRMGECTSVKSSSEIPPWKKARTKRVFSGHIGVKKHRQKLPEFSHTFRSVQASSIPSGIVAERSSSFKFPVETKIQEQPATSCQGAVGALSETPTFVAVETSFSQQRVSTDVPIQVLMSTYSGANKDVPPEISRPPQITVEIPMTREEANEADFILDDLDIGLPVDLGPSPCLQDRSVRPTFEIMPFEPDTLLPIDMLQMADLGGIHDLL